jgi:hypothetical protein
MPVENHEVHPHGIRPAGHKAGCYNRGPFSPGYYATNRSYEGKHWRLVAVWVPHRLSTECRQDGALPECNGCTAPKDHKYINQMKEMT